MATADELLALASKEYQAVLGLRQRLSHTSSYAQRATINQRIRQLEDDLNRLYAQYLRVLKKPPITVYGTRKHPRVYAGLSVQMDISTDGLYFSNPAPTVAHSARVWVRARIEVAQKSPFSTVKTEIPEFIRCTWVIPRSYKSLDLYSRFGRDEPLVSMPLVITREFHAPSSGSTKANFGMFADPYYPVDIHLPLPSGAAVEVSNVWAEITAGSYYLYTRSANVLTARTLTTFSTTSVSVNETDERLLYTDVSVNTYLNVREILSGPHTGTYIIIAQDGITLREEQGQVT